MELDIFEEGFGRVAIAQQMPTDLQPFLMEPASPFVLQGDKMRALLQQFSGEGFDAWFTRVWAKKSFILYTRSDLSVLELRVAWRHRIKGTWDKIEEASLPPFYFQLAFTPYINTKAIFENPVEYQTFDIHFSLDYLQSFGLDYKMMDVFINRVDLRQVAELAVHPYPCSRDMVQLIDMLLRSDYSLAGKRRQQHHHIAAILTAALEVVSVEEGVKLPLTAQDKAALYRVREILDTEPVDEYPGNDTLLRHVRPYLNTWKLNYGFKQLFGTNPQDYFLNRRFSEAQERLARGQKIIDIAYWMGYGSATTFGKEFRKRFGMSPTQWRTRG